MDNQKKEGPHAANVGAGNTTGLDGEVSQPTVPVQAGPADEIEVTFFRDRLAYTLSADVMTLAKLRDKILQTSAPTKAALPLLKLATFGGVKSDKGCLTTR